MNVNDIAHSLGKAIVSSKEYKEYYKKHNEIKSNKKAKEMVKDFRQKAMDIQMLQMSGKNVNKDIFDDMKKLEDVLMSNSLINEYFTYEMRFSEMMNEVYKILGDYIKINIELDK